MSESKVLNSLKGSLLFELASEQVLSKVAEIVQLKSFSADENLIEKGQLGDAMYIVCSGKVKIHDGDLLLNYLGQGSAFGEMSALENEVRTASVTAVEDTELIELKHDALMDLLGREPEVGKAMIHFLCQRGKNIYSDITDRSFKLRAMEKEFEIGRTIQAGFLPEKIPEISGWDIAAFFQAAKEVAGDFYDVFELKKQRKTAFVIGDVCGKGVGAALFMTLFRSLLRASILAEDFIDGNDSSNSNTENPIYNYQKILIDALSMTNNYVAQTHEKACMFATIFVGLLDPENGSMFYVNAGHESPVVINAAGVKESLAPTGPAAGLFTGMEFSVGETQLDPGDSFFAFTDGACEAVNKKEQQFTSQRLLDIIINNTSSSEVCLEGVVRELSEFTAGVEPFDDITLLQVTRLKQ